MNQGMNTLSEAENQLFCCEEPNEFGYRERLCSFNVGDRVQIDKKQKSDFFLFYQNLSQYFELIGTVVQIKHVGYMNWNRGRVSPSPSEDYSDIYRMKIIFDNKHVAEEMIPERFFVLVKKIDPCNTIDTVPSTEPTNKQMKKRTTGKEKISLHDLRNEYGLNNDSYSFFIKQQKSLPPMLVENNVILQHPLEITVLKDNVVYIRPVNMA